jgi:DNA recombination protein RmuC
MEPLATILALALLPALIVISVLVLERGKTARALDEARGESIQARRDAEHAETRRKDETARLEQISLNLRADLDNAEKRARELGEKLARAEEQNAADRRMHASREQTMLEERNRLQNWVQDQEKQLKDHFARLSAEALDTNARRFLEQAKENFAHQLTQAGAELDQRRKAVDELVRPIGETLAKTEERLIQLTERVDLTSAASEALRTSTDKLVQAFSRPEIRGRYGEIQLKRVAELAGMVAYCDFDEQSSARTDEGRLLRPDMIVKLPNDRVVVVDAKCNIDAYVRALEVFDAGERETLLAKFAEDVASQAGKLARKGYWEQYAGSPDFVVMFVPGDHFLDAALARRPDLLEIAAEQRVILASPATLIGLLRAVAVGWREHALTEQARELFELGKELHERAAVAYGHIDELGKALEKATRKYNDAVGSIQSRLTPTLRRFEESGAKSARALPEPSEITTLPREIDLTGPA